jgi:hypothetical protein
MKTVEARLRRKRDVRVMPDDAGHIFALPQVWGVVWEGRRGQEAVFGH